MPAVRLLGNTTNYSTSVFIWSAWNSSFCHQRGAMPAWTNSDLSKWHFWRRFMWQEEGRWSCFVFFLTYFFLSAKMSCIKCSSINNTGLCLQVCWVRQGGEGETSCLLMTTRRQTFTSAAVLAKFSRRHWSAWHIRWMREGWNSLMQQQRLVTSEEGSSSHHLTLTTRHLEMHNQATKNLQHATIFILLYNTVKV